MFWFIGRFISGIFVFNYLTPGRPCLMELIAFYKRANALATAEMKFHIFKLRKKGLSICKIRKKRTCFHILMNLQCMIFFTKIQDGRLSE